MKNSPETLRKRNELKRFWKTRINPKSFSHKILKKCKDCGKNKLCSWQSSFTQTGAPEYRARCDDCFKKYKKHITKKSRSRITSQKRKRSRKNKEKCVNYLGGKCIICGYRRSLFALTFHHRNPKTKIKNISLMFQDMSFNNKKLINELDKCDLLCFNCHMEIHGEENDAR